MKRGAVYLVSQDSGAPRARGVGRAAQAWPGGSQAAPMPTSPAGVAGVREVRAEERGNLRPVVLVSRDAINRHSPVVLICPLVDAASVRKLYPSDVVVRAPEGGLTADSVVLTGQLRALARTQLVRYLGDLSAELMRAIDQALRITLDLE